MPWRYYTWSCTANIYSNYSSNTLVYTTSNSGSNYTEYGADHSGWVTLPSYSSIPSRSGYELIGYSQASGATAPSLYEGSDLWWTDRYNWSHSFDVYCVWRPLVTAPTITTQPSSQSVYKGASATLSVAATTAYGTLSYQWQSSLDGASWSDLVGETSTSLTPPTTATGTTYYRCVVTSTAAGQSKTATSSVASFTVNDTPTAYISVQPADTTAFVGETKSVSVTASGNSLAYQWYSSSDGENFTAISGATSNSYTYPTSVYGTNYYKCEITNTLNGYTATTSTRAAKIDVADVSTPVFITNPNSQVAYIGVAADEMTVLATSNGTISYQWQSSPNGSTWSDISGETVASYTPPSNTAGTKYYRVVATASGGSQTKTANSQTATVQTVVASVPVFNTDLSGIDAEYTPSETANALDGSATAPYGTITYQWYRSTDNGLTWVLISGETSDRYTPPTAFNGVYLYRVVATNVVGTSSQTATSKSAKITITNSVLSPAEKWSQYLKTIKGSFVKLARLDFLQPNGSVSYSLDNNPLNKRSGAFIQSGSLTVNLQNGQRRTATVTLSNLDGEYDYSVNKLWFGQQVQLWEGVKLPNGEDFYISQGVFYVKDPEETFKPGLKQTTLNLVDKWAYLDGTLFGNLDGTYEVPLNSNIFNAIASILLFDRGNGYPVDSAAPIFTGYYNGKTTTLPDGTTVPLTNTPYTYRCDSENGTYADIILELNTMLAGWIGYDSCGQLRLSPSQDDILDQTKPIQWEFTPKNCTFQGATYSVKNSEVYNDIIIIGESLSEYGQTAGRATNYDPRSDTNANIIGLKTKRYSQSGYYTQDICESMAVFKLKRQSVLKKSVTIETTQMFHLQENNLVTIQRTDKPGNPIERHLIMGFTRPIAQDGSMSISACSVMDWPVATITQAP